MGEESEQCLVMFKQADYVMVTVSDMSRSVRFYRDVLGLLLKSESPKWSEFTTGPTTLALHGGGKQGPAQMGPRGESFAGTCSIGFNVDDVDGTFHELKSKGANFVMPLLSGKEKVSSSLSASTRTGFPSHSPRRPAERRSL